MYYIYNVDILSKKHGAIQEVLQDRQNSSPTFITNGVSSLIIIIVHTHVIKLGFSKIIMPLHIILMCPNTTCVEKIAYDGVDMSIYVC